MLSISAHLCFDAHFFHRGKNVKKLEFCAIISEYIQLLFIKVIYLYSLQLVDNNKKVPGKFTLRQRPTENPAAGLAKVYEM